MRMGSLALSLIFWIVSVILVVWVVNCPPDQLILSASLCAIAPVLALVLAKLSHGLIVISGQKSEQRPDVFPLWLLPSVGLVIPALGPMHIINWQIAFICAGGIAVAWSSLAFGMATFSREWGKVGSFVILFLVGLAYGYGVVCLANTVIDRKTLRVTEVTVIRKYIRGGKDHTRYLALGPSVVSPKGGDESVSLEIYEKAVVSQKVCLVEHPGSLGLKWYEILLCESTLPA